jgi:hypothetical protein
MPTGSALPPRRDVQSPPGSLPPTRAATSQHPTLAPSESESSEERRLIQEEIPITLDGSLLSLLESYPSPWLRAIARALGIRSGTHNILSAIVAALGHARPLTQAINHLSVPARQALVLLLQSGGWTHYDLIVNRVGAEHGDGYQWDRQPPQTPLGQLRLHGLLVVGTTQQQGVWFKVAVVPRDLRERLRPLLASVQAEPPLPPPPAPGLPLVLHWAQTCYSHLGPRAIIPPLLMRTHLTQLAEKDLAPADLVAVWDDLDDLHHFLIETAPDVTVLADLRPAHLRGWVNNTLLALHTTLPAGPQPTSLLGSDPPLGPYLNQLQKHVTALLQTAIQLGLLPPGRLPQLRAALAALPEKGAAQQAPTLSPAAPFPAPESAPINSFPPSAPTAAALFDQHQAPVRFTVAEIRLLLTWRYEFDGDWEQIRRATAMVPAGPAKARLATRLRRLDPTLIELLLTGEFTPQTIADGLRWFHAGTFDDDE